MPILGFLARRKRRLLARAASVGPGNTPGRAASLARGCTQQDKTQSTGTLLLGSEADQEVCEALESSQVAPRSRLRHQRAKTEDLQQIQKDIPRTFFDQPDVLQLAGVTEEVLRKYAAADAEVGYCQGMSFVAAVTAFQFRSIDAAYPHFWAIVNRIRGLWLPGLPLLLTGVSAFEALCSSSFEDLQQCLSSQSVAFDMFLPDAWLTLFSRWVPFAALWAVFEFVKAEGFPGVLAITVVLLKAHKSVLLDAADFKDMFVILKELAKQPRQPDVLQLVSAARELVPQARGAMEASAALPRQTTSSLTRCGPCVVHENSGIELLDCGWSTLTATLQAVTGRAAAFGEEAARGRDSVLAIFGVRAGTSTPPSGSARSSPSSIASARARRRGLPCLCAGSAPRDDA